MAARRWKIIFPGPRDRPGVGDTLGRRISRSMESVETIVSNLRSLGEGERLSSSTMELGRRGAKELEEKVTVVGKVKQEVPSSPGAGDSLVREVGGGWQEWRHPGGRLYYHSPGAGRSSWKPPRGLKGGQVVGAVVVEGEVLGLDVPQGYSARMDTMAGVVYYVVSF